MPSDLPTPGRDESVAPEFGPLSMPDSLGSPTECGFFAQGFASVDEHWMTRAIDQARRAFDREEVPVGAVIVHEGRIIGEGYNQRESLQDPTAHAEMIALTQAATALQSWRLLDCSLYVTLEPCPMCAGAIVQARIPVLVYGTEDPKAGACRSLYRITEDSRLNHRVLVREGVLREDCRSLLREFFVRQRALGKK